MRIVTGYVGDRAVIETAGPVNALALTETAANCEAEISKGEAVMSSRLSRHSNCERRVRRFFRLVVNDDFRAGLKSLANMWMILSYDNQLGS